MGRNGMGRKGYGPKWSWAEMVMGRNDPEPRSVHSSKKFDMNKVINLKQLDLIIMQKFKYL